MGNIIHTFPNKTAGGELLASRYPVRNQTTGTLRSPNPWQKTAKEGAGRGRAEILASRYPVRNQTTGDTPEPPPLAEDC